MFVVFFAIDGECSNTTEMRVSKENFEWPEEFKIKEQTNSYMQRQSRKLSQQGSN